MKLALNLSLFLFSLVIFSDRSFALTDFEIKRICQKEIRESKCIENYKEKRSLLLKGKQIEIPITPYKR